eukprot:1151606-Pelagomonas_calceolata.AAC.3
MIFVGRGLSLHQGRKKEKETLWGQKTLVSAVYLYSTVFCYEFTDLPLYLDFFPACSFAQAVIHRDLKPANMMLGGHKIYNSQHKALCLVREFSPAP